MVTFLTLRTTFDIAATVEIAKLYVTNDPEGAFRRRTDALRSSVIVSPPVVLDATTSNNPMSQCLRLVVSKAAGDKGFGQKNMCQNLDGEREDRKEVNAGKAIAALCKPQ